MKFIKIFIFAILAFYSFQLSAQDRFKGWEVYTSMRDVRSIDVASNGMFWAASTGGLFSFFPEAPANITKYTNLTGLTQNQLSAVKIVSNGSIFAGGFDGSINVFRPSSNTWIYVNDIKVSSETSKRINHFFEYGNDLFISTEFGISRFNISQLQFVDQPYIYLGAGFTPKPIVRETYVVNDTIWAATEFGIAYANINSNLPIQSNWKNFTIYNSNLISSSVYTITYFQDRVFFGSDSSMVYHYDDSLYRYQPLYNGIPLTVPVIKMTSLDEYMYIATGAGDNKIYRVHSSDLMTAELVMENITATSLKLFKDNAGVMHLMVGTSDRGVVYNGTSVIYPNGPYSNLFFEMSIDIHGNLWVSSGSEGFYKFDRTTWTNFTVDKYPIMGSNSYKHILASKFNDAVWTGNFGRGLLKIEGETMSMYDTTNSVLEGFGGGDFVIIEGIAEDHLGRIWVINRAVSNPIVNITDQVSYFGWDTPVQNTFINIAIDQFGTKWMNYPNDVTGSPRGVAYLNEEYNSKKIINAGELGADMTTANDVVVDHNGEVWIGTDNGIAIVRNPFQVLANPNTNPSFSKMAIIENGLQTPFTEGVSVVEVDALNNKWIGTQSNGVIYVSSDGTTILNQFNTSNSPLPDNAITSITIDGKTGRVYFGTQRGAASFLTTAITPLEECDQITVGPNPFIIPGNTSLRIDGLVAGSSVKILSISGTLMAEFDTPGGRVGTWDGRDLNGNLVPSGVYIIVGYNGDGSKVCTGKVAVVRR